MDREAIVVRLGEDELGLGARGVAHVALCGSRARGEAGTESDTENMIEIDADTHRGVWGYAGLQAYTARLFDRSVKEVIRDSLKRYAILAATIDAIYTF